ncbi:hypothetical protein Fmac_027859 [Flemingia macrophylla]|uniref:Uncharacterized protein n=1 Tax=Flemingia macrophylla TaxID=520843 RepID=A0ABD1LKJ3_9FABA
MRTRGRGKGVIGGGGENEEDEVTDDKRGGGDGEQERRSLQASTLRSTTTANATNPPLREPGERIRPWPRLPWSRLSLPRPIPTESATPTPVRGSSFAPATGAWKPWGWLKAWCKRNGSDDLDYRFELISDTNDGMSATGIVLAESMLSSNKGGKFVINISYRDSGGSNGRTTLGSTTTPACSLRSCGDYVYELWPYCMYRGFVMSASVEGEGRCSKLTVEVNVPHVNCMEDVALVVTVYISVDACKLFF